MIEGAWINGLLGGVVIGCAGAVLLLLNGRVAGISGILAQLLPPWGMADQRRSLGPAVAFLVGLGVAPIALAQTGYAVPVSITDNVAVLIVGGLLVGFGTRLGSGCTSGHGVCGLSRGSVRSLVAVGTFMAVAAVTTAVVRLTTGAVQ